MSSSEAMELSEGSITMTEQPRRSGPRLNHKKSRAGCQRCKARRVKCDEARPACSGCTRHSVPCIYSGPASTSRPHSSQPASSTRTDVSITPDPTNDNTLHLPESRQRRMLELRLWHNFIAVLARSFIGVHQQEIADIWNIHLPKLALEYDNLLYSLYCVSSSNLLRADPGNLELLAAHQTYLSLALREQREAVSRLENTQTLIADAVCFASLIMCMDSFASLQDRNREPYVPPVEFCKLGMGIFAVFAAAVDTAKSIQGSKIETFLQGPPRFHDNIPDLFHENHRKPFLGLLGPRNPDGSYKDKELWDEEVCTAYEHTLSYIGTLFTAIENREPLALLLRRVLSFSVMIPKKFVAMLEELRPRALVILAHYFALASEAKTHWWVAEAPVREIQGLVSIIPQEWQHHMEWPLLFSGIESN